MLAAINIGHAIDVRLARPTVARVTALTPGNCGMSSSSKANRVRASSTRSTITKSSIWIRSGLRHGERSVRPQRTVVRELHVMAVLRGSLATRCENRDLPVQARSSSPARQASTCRAGSQQSATIRRPTHRRTTRGFINMGSVDRDWVHARANGACSGGADTRSPAIDDLDI